MRCYLCNAIGPEWYRNPHGATVCRKCAATYLDVKLDQLDKEDPTPTESDFAVTEDGTLLCLDAWNKGSCILCSLPVESGFQAHLRCWDRATDITKNHICRLRKKKNPLSGG
jgi:ribosomal protein L40E